MLSGKSQTTHNKTSDRVTRHLIFGVGLGPGLAAVYNAVNMYFTGFTCLVNNASESQGTGTPRVVFISSSDKPESNATNLRIIDNDNNAEMRTVNVRDQIRTGADIYVFAKQGKSRHTGLLNLDSLIRSCENLDELDPKIQSDQDNYVIPCGLKDGLAGQVVVLHG